MIKYVFKDKPQTLKGDVDPQKAGEAIAKIKGDTDGRCNARTIYHAAVKDKKNYLRDCLAWDDKFCGVEYRIMQIREIIRCIDIVDNSIKPNGRMPAFISLIERTGRGYRTAQEVLDSDLLQSLTFDMIERELAAIQRKAAQFSEIFDVLTEARRLLAERRAKAKKKKKGEEDQPQA